MTDVIAVVLPNFEVTCQLFGKRYDINTCNGFTTQLCRSPASQFFTRSPPRIQQSGKIAQARDIGVVVIEDARVIYAKIRLEKITRSLKREQELVLGLQIHMDHYPGSRILEEFNIGNSSKCVSNILQIALKESHTSTINDVVDLGERENMVSEYRVKLDNNRCNNCVVNNNDSYAYDYRMMQALITDVTDNTQMTMSQSNAKASTSAMAKKVRDDRVITNPVIFLSDRCVCSNCRCYQYDSHG